MHTYHAPLDLVRERSPERPVALVRPGAVAVAAHWFRDNLKADVLYAVKANPSPWVIRALHEAGVTGFDVASIPEIELVAAHAPGARLAFMHPVKSRMAIARAYAEFGVRTFALDSHEELAKILAATGGVDDLNLIVRMAVSAEGAQYTLSGKFGVPTDQAPGAAARRPRRDQGADGRQLPRGQPVHAAHRLPGGHGAVLARHRPAPASSWTWWTWAGASRRSTPA